MFGKTDSDKPQTFVFLLVLMGRIQQLDSQCTYFGIADLGFILNNTHFYNCSTKYIFLEANNQSKHL